MLIQVSNHLSSADYTNVLRGGMDIPPPLLLMCRRLDFFYLYVWIVVFTGTLLNWVIGKKS
jgi:hypothetical protein